MSESTAPTPRRSWIAFAIVIALLVISAVGLRVTIAQMKITFRKLPVKLSAPLLDMRPTLGPWVQASVDRALNPDIEHELGTREYVMRDYIDTRLLDAGARDRFIAASLEDREKMMHSGELKLDNPASIMRFALTFYTGSADTVPHVSERCFVADGWRPSAFDVVKWPILSRQNESDRLVEVRLMNFEDQVGSRAFRPRQVCYFFQVNGKYKHDPIFGVRKELQNLFERHAYFAKVEMVTGMDSVADAAPVMTDFLQHAMPEIERVLPDWSKVKGNESDAASPEPATKANP
jgi:hypothetical protein